MFTKRDIAEYERISEVGYVLAGSLMLPEDGEYIPEERYVCVRINRTHRQRILDRVTLEYVRRPILSPEKEAEIVAKSNLGNVFDMRLHTKPETIQAQLARAEICLQWVNPDFVASDRLDATTRLHTQRGRFEKWAAWIRSKKGENPVPSEQEGFRAHRNRMLEDLTDWSL